MNLSLEALGGFLAVIATVVGTAAKNGRDIGSLQSALSEIKEALTNRVQALEREVEWLREQVVEIMKGDHAK